MTFEPIEEVEDRLRLGEEVGVGVDPPERDGRELLARDRRPQEQQHRQRSRRHLTLQALRPRVRQGESTTVRPREVPVDLESPALPRERDPEPPPAAAALRPSRLEAPAARGRRSVSRKASSPANGGRMTTRVVSRNVNGSASGFATAWRSQATGASAGSRR